MLNMNHIIANNRKLPLILVLFVFLLLSVQTLDLRDYSFKITSIEYLFLKMIVITCALRQWALLFHLYIANPGF